MGVSYLAISAVSTVISFIGLQCWTEITLEKFKSDGLIGADTLYSENASRIFELLLRSHSTITLLAVSVINVFLLFCLCLKAVFFGRLHASEIRKLGERLVNYIIYKGIFLPLIIPPTIFQASMWFTWLTVLCFLKMFQALAKDRLERLNASPSATHRTYFRVYSALPLVLAVDILWIWFCVAISAPVVSSTYWLLFFEPLSIAFETLQAMVLHGFQLMDIWLHHSAAVTSDCQKFKLSDSTAGSLLEWKSYLVRNMGFFLDIMTLLMALGHYVHIWWLHGMTFHLVDAILFLNVRALLSEILKRVKRFIKLKIALSALHKALPDATSEEIQAYDDECAICREPMGKAKRLPCKHLFHLSCLRSWLDQAVCEKYSCPNCRKPLFVGRSINEASSNTRAVSSDEQLARQLGAGSDPPNAGALGGTFSSLNQNSVEAGTRRGPREDTSWLQPWPSQGQDEAGPSATARSVRLERLQMMMRHLATVGETYAQTSLDDTSWSLWPGSTSQATTSGTDLPFVVPRYPTTTVHRRATSNPASDSIASLVAMAETVREVLPHVPDELIFQDLQQTHSVAVTVNNLLQM